MNKTWDELTEKTQMDLMRRAALAGFRRLDPEEHIITNHIFRTWRPKKQTWIWVRSLSEKGWDHPDYLFEVYPSASNLGKLRVRLVRKEYRPDGKPFQVATGSIKRAKDILRHYPESPD